MKNVKKVMLILMCGFTIYSCSNTIQMKKKSEVKKESKVSNYLNRTELKKRLIYNILLNTNEYYAHNLGDVTTNKVFLHKDGHQEAVYDDKGKLVTDEMNKGSYNHFNPLTQPIAHFEVDTIPWINFGNSPKDNSTKSMRVEAFAKDFVSGLYKVVMDWDVQLDFDDKSEKSKTMISFISIFDQPEFDQYKFDGSDEWLKNQDKYNQFEKLVEEEIIEFFK